MERLYCVMDRVTEGAAEGAVSAGAHCVLRIVHISTARGGCRVSRSRLCVAGWL